MKVTHSSKIEHNKSKKGTDLELRSAAYFQAHGFLIRRDVMLSVSAGTSDITDIDMLGIRFNIPLSEERLIADCKERKKSKPFERILWTTGLSVFCKAHRSCIVVPHAPWQAREFASKVDVEVLDEEQMDAYLNSVKGSFISFSEADENISYRVNYAKKQIGDKYKEVIREDLKLRQMLVVGKPLTNLNRIIVALSNLYKLPTPTTEYMSWLRRYLCYNAAVTASVMLARFSAESKWTSESDWKDHAKKTLTYGDVPPKKAQQLARLALEQTFYEGLPTPKYADELIMALQAMISNPSVAAVVPYTVDFLLLGRVLGGMSDEYIPPVLLGTFENSTKMAKRIMSVIAYAAEIPSDVWEVGKRNSSGEKHATECQTVLPIKD